MSKYNVGDQVRIIDHRGACWNSRGEMDKYMSKVLTIEDEYSGVYTMSECPNWRWTDDDIAELVSSPADIEPTNGSESNDKTDMHDAPIEFNLDMAKVISDFVDNVLDTADKYNIDRREVLTVAAKTLEHTYLDDFFWNAIVPLNDAFKNVAKYKR